MDAGSKRNNAGGFWVAGMDENLLEVLIMENRVKLRVKKLHKDAILPHYAHDGDAGMDLYAVEDVILWPNEPVAIRTGISIELPKGYVALIWDKSGLALKEGIKTMAGVCDANYRGEYKVVLLNTTNQYYYIDKGDKLAQMLIQSVMHAEIEEIQEGENLSETSRGSGGFGSTGMRKPAEKQEVKSPEKLQQ
ncbi:MAG: dUTP diphosphatase [archaeon]|nr:dUTP diphosphatase [archaeon]